MMRWMLCANGPDSRAILNDISTEELREIDRQIPTTGNKNATINGRNSRIIKISNKEHVLIGISNDKDHVKSKSSSEREAMLMMASANNVFENLARAQDRAESQARRLVHNLKGLNAKTMQEIFYVVRQDELQASFAKATKYIKEQILNRPDEAAEALLLILKHQSAQKSEFSAFEKLNGNISSIKKERHHVHKVLMNAFYLFFADFSEKKAVARVEPTEIQASFDYESIHACIYHLVENSAKYIRPGGSLNVSTKSLKNEVEIIFDMESLPIGSSEVENIFDEGYSGVRARAQSLNGSGIGLYIARRIAALNGGSLTVVAGNPRAVGIDYARNKFILVLPTT